MRIIHRYLVLELLRNVLMFLAVIIAIYFIMSLALTLGRSAVEGLPIWVVLKATWHTVISNLHLILPLTILSSAIFTYGRANSEGEFTAMRVAGIHPYQALVPALFIGSLGTAGLAWTQDELMPASHFASRVELRKDIFVNLDEILKSSRREIGQKRWSARWGDTVSDPEGNLVLEGLIILQKDKTGRMTNRLVADYARPVYIEEQNTLHMVLENVRRWEEGAVTPIRAGVFELDLDLDELSTRESAVKRRGDFSYEELLNRWKHLRSRAEVLPSGGKEQARMRRKAEEHRCMYHFRIAFAFSSILFGLLGATLGLYRPWNNRALVFLVGFVIVVAIYYPLQQLGRRMGDSETLHPGISLWLGNAVLITLSLFMFRKVCR